MMTSIDMAEANLVYLHAQATLSEQQKYLCDDILDEFNRIMQSGVFKRSKLGPDEKTEALRAALAIFIECVRIQRGE